MSEIETQGQSCNTGPTMHDKLNQHAVASYEVASGQPVIIFVIAGLQLLYEQDELSVNATCDQWKRSFSKQPHCHYRLTPKLGKRPAKEGV